MASQLLLINDEFQIFSQNRIHTEVKLYIFWDISAVKKMLDLSPQKTLGLYVLRIKHFKHYQILGN